MANPELLGVEPAHGSITSGRLLGPGARAVALMRDLVVLTKPRITALVLLTGAAGMRLSPPGQGRLGARTMLLALIGTALIVGSANTLNMWWERDVDACMVRTRNRPLPAGRLSPEVALVFGLGLAIVSVPMLFAVNAVTGLLGLVALVSYVAIYTPLKRHSHFALLVGAVPGAIPPLLGWSAATGSVAAGGLLLFALLFFWQIPHFGAIAIFRSEDYARAGLQVVSVQHGERAACRMVAAFAVVFVVVSLLFAPLGLAGARYTAAAVLLGVAFLALVFRGVTAAPGLDVRRWARRVFAASIPYLTFLLVALLCDRGGS